ncbi:MAG TPA: RecQ family ATP-dependent DNA helicase, partial [Flavisolibacter sp.]|nr:RecQ family ATP-dependent DNA helicase [Flavisolibacter sp.]
SICYQVPALSQEGICIVVSPLIALMKDQVENLKARGIGALVIYAGMQRKDIIRTLENAREDYFKFLYVSPERLETSLFKEYLPALNVNLIAVDEAHCISQWGYDFRPSYLKIAALREELPDVPVLAVTASATEAVQKDICEKLAAPGKQQGFTVFRQSFERKNLSYSVFQVAAKATKLVDIFKKVQGSGIVYCKSRKRTTEVASLLQMHGISANFYHAGLTTQERGKRQQDWIDNKTRIIVCTNAFGMGIDKPDVRTVVHTDAPDCLENYYQEAGRCGRDGKKAYAVLLYEGRDVEELENLHVSRFPSFETIRQVYDALTNFLQVHVNEGQDRSYNFRFDEFVRNFKLNVHQALYALQALESDGWIEYNEKNFSPSTLCFTISKSNLYEFYRSHPELENLLTTLLRTYEGIFNFPVFVSEALVSKLLRHDEATIKADLKKAMAFGVIRYTQQNDAPQIVFRKNRVATNDLRINLAAYQKRKEAFVQRVKTMVTYLQTTECRSAFIGSYFGDPELVNCGICDNCLAKKQQSLSPAEFSSIAIAIKQTLSAKQLTADELFRQLPRIKRETAWQVLQFLQAEKQVLVNGEGLLANAANSV